MELIFQVSMQYCSLQRRPLLPSPVTSTAGCCFCFGSISSFFLDLFLHWSPIAYWAPTDLGSSSLSVLFFFFFAFSYCSWGSQCENIEVACHSLLHGQQFVRTLHHDLSILAVPTWHGSKFHELEKAVVHVIKLVSLLYFSLSALWWRKITRLWKRPDRRDWLRGKLGLVLMGGAMLSKSSVQFSVDG